MDRRTSTNICVIMSFWQVIFKLFHNDEEDTEVIEVNGEKHTVLKRDNYTVGNDFAAASFVVIIMHR